MMLIPSVFFVCAFLLGSIPVGALVAKARGVDILSAGSGNIGGTNVYRVLGPVPGIMVSLFDILKGFAPAFTALYLFKGDQQQVYALCAGLTAVLGHCFSPFLKFKGGKGIASGFGALLGATPIVAGGVLVVFILVIAITRYVSLASIIAPICMVIFGILLREPTILVWMYVALAVFIVYKHRGNMSRLIAGTERRFQIKPEASAKHKPEEKGSSDDTTIGKAKP